ncbi:MAG: hypothetical protein IIU44_01640 [Spirochaetales bacterium]|nr:hypothetical protein [Spirochaetales bacterium]
MEHESCSARTLSARLGYSGVSVSFNNALADLERQGLIRKTGVGKATLYSISNS